MTETSPSAQTRPLALVTGASSGIGLELARQFADHGYDLVIAAEDEHIESVAAELAGTGIWVEPVRVDLSAPDGVELLWQVVEAGGRPLAAAALNAGIGEGGDFATQTPLDAELRIVDLNVRSTVHLGKRVAAHMTEQRAGRILVTSSIASQMPGTFQTVYNASKSFTQSFAEGLREELSEHGVSVTALMPGPTETNFFHRARMDDTPVGQSDKDDPADVAAQGFEALMRGDQKVVAGSLMTKVQGLANRVVPDSVKAKVHKKMAEPGGG
jgi:short-subunit dehydrogenase